MSDGEELTYEQRLRRDMDRWQISYAMHMQLDYGHSFSTAWLLARFSRDMLEAELRKPLPLCMLVGLGPGI